MENNYKNKYLALRLKFMNSVDQAFRLGYEQGQQDAQLDQMAQAQQAAQQQQQDPNDPNAQGEEGQEGQEGQEQEGQGSELDQHINNLEQAVGGQGEGGAEAVQKALTELKSFQAKRKFQVEMKKSDKAVKAIAKAMAPKLPLRSEVAKTNMDSNAKAALSLQEKIVNDVMKSFADEEAAAEKKISSVLNIEGLIKKE